MDPATFTSITNLVDKARNILVLTHTKPDGDALGASLSLYMALKAIGKEVVVATNDPIKDNLSFLPGTGSFQYSLGVGKDFVITLDTSKTAISKIKYTAEGTKFHIIVSPKDGQFSAQEVTLEPSKAKYDLIFVLDSGNLDHLGPLYEKNPQLFFEAPVINIDHHASNTDFGKVNMVESIAASTTEILFGLLKEMEKKYAKKLIDADVATLLLAGLITDTGSFQNANTTPKSLDAAADLIDLGARQQEIVKHVFKTKKLSTLKLWGQILSKVQVDPLHRMVWSSISLDNMKESEAQPEETEGIIDDLLTNAPGAEVIFLIKEHQEGYVSVSMRSTGSAIDVSKFCVTQGGGGHARAAGFKVYDKKPMVEIVADVVKKVREFQAARLNIHDTAVEPLTRGAASGVEQLRVEPQKPVQQREAAQPLAPREAAPQSVKPVEKKVTYLEFPGKPIAEIQNSKPKTQNEIPSTKSQAPNKPETQNLSIKPQISDKPEGQIVPVISVPAEAVQTPWDALKKAEVDKQMKPTEATAQKPSVPKANELKVEPKKPNPAPVNKPVFAAKPKTKDKPSSEQKV